MNPGETALDRTLEYLLRIYDGSQKGKLDRAEALLFFRELFQYYKASPSQESLEQLFEIVDFNGDGYITKQELLKIIKTSQYF